MVQSERVADGVDSLANLEVCGAGKTRTISDMANATDVTATVPRDALSSLLLSVT